MEHVVRRWTGFAVAVALVVVGVVLAGPAPEAAAAAPSTRSWFVQGDLAVTGNVLGFTNAPTDQDAVPGTPGLPSAGTAATVRSSTALLDLPPGSTVVSATLYAFQTNLSGTLQTPVTSAQVSIGGGPYDTVVLESTGTGATGGSAARMLRADITGQLAATHSAAQLWVGITASESVWAWSAQVVYENAASGWHQITVVDKAQAVTPPANISATVPALAVEPGTSADAVVSTFVLYSTIGHTDAVRVCPGTTPCPDTSGARTAANGYAGNAQSPYGDVQNKTWTRDGVPHPGMYPSPSASDGRFTGTNLAVSVDLDVFTLVDALPDSATSATVSLITPQDTLFAGVVSMSVPTFTPLPQLTTSVTPPAPTSACDPCLVDVVQSLQLGSSGSNGYGATVTHTLPAGVTVVGPPVPSTPADPVAVSGGVLTWSPGVVVAGAPPRTVGYRISVPRALLASVLTLTANASMQGPPPVVQAFTATSTAPLPVFAPLISVLGVALPSGTSSASACSTTDLVLSGTDLAGAVVAVGGRALTTRPGAAGALVVELPAGLAPGGVTLDLTAANGARTTAATTVGPRPAVTGASPAAGPLGGGTVRLSGTGLAGAVSVLLDGVAVPAQDVAADGSWITAVLPAHDPGTVALAVPVPGTGCAPTTAYRYAAPPVVTAVRASGLAGPGGRITLTGTDLLGGVVTVDGRVAQVLVEEATRLVVQAPQGLAAGRFVVSVRTPGGEVVDAGTVVVTGVGNGLALTGMPIAEHAGVALVALLAGAGLLWCGRRTRPTRVAGHQGLGL